MKKFNKTKIAKAVSNHKAEIFTGIGIACMISSTVLAVKETPKALQLLEEKKLELETDKLTALETVKTAWKCYIPSTAASIAGTIFLISGSVVGAKRTAAIAAAYKLSESALLEYRDKVVETIGEKKEATIKDKIAKDHIDKDPSASKEIIFTGKGDSLCYDMFSARYFKSNIDEIKKAEIDLNHLLINRDYVCLNDYYDAIGLKHDQMGYRLGWRVDRGKIKFYYSSQLADDGTPCLTIDFDTPPEYDFDKFA